jgi:NAD+ synthase (glutamine-hydrolysing)
MGRLRIAACQLDCVVGDLDGNVARILDAYDRAEAAGCDLAVFSELCICAYPPEDLLLKPGFVADNLAALDKLAAGTGRCAAVVGFVDRGRDLYDAAAVCADGRVVGTYRKRHLPNYAVFDEQRYFAPGTEAYQLYDVAGVKVGVSVCEDAWDPVGPIAQQAAGGAEVMVSINASPFYVGRVGERERMLATRATDASCALVYVNQVGGQDELVFDGASLVLDSAGRVVAAGPQFAEAVVIVDLDVRPVFRKRLLDPRGRASAAALPVVPVSHVLDDRPDVDPPAAIVALDASSELWHALVLGTRDYVTKTGFTDVVIGLSGGIDSSLVAALAVDALGPAHVHTVSMPSRYSSPGSKADARMLADSLGIEMRTVDIDPAHTAFDAMLDATGLADENLQSRLRGVVLMAFSNANGWMVLTTGNKSELAVGYSTLYGDTAGGYAVIKDVPKTRVYELCRWYNRRAGRAVIPQEVLDKAPSAELRPDQRDDESLPPYDVLDPVLEAYVEDDLTAAELVAAGFAPDVVARVTRLVDLAEYKRRQSPLGVRVTPKAFGKDRRMPIVNRYNR